MDNSEFQGFTACLVQHASCAFVSRGRRISRAQFLKDLSEKDAELGRLATAYFEAGDKVARLIDVRNSDMPAEATALPLEFNGGGHLL